MQSKARKLALKICLLYCFVAATWIVASDRTVEWLVSSEKWINLLQTYKGLAFIAVSALLLYFVLVRTFGRSELAAAKQSQA